MYLLCFASVPLKADICCAVITWGTISAATSAAKSYGALLGIRVVLGASEAVFFPGVLYYLSAWYVVWARYGLVLKRQVHKEGAG